MIRTSCNSGILPIMSFKIRPSWKHYFTNCDGCCKKNYLWSAIRGIGFGWSVNTKSSIVANILQLVYKFLKIEVNYPSQWSNEVPTLMLRWPVRSSKLTMAQCWSSTVFLNWYPPRDMSQAPFDGRMSCLSAYSMSGAFKTRPFNFTMLWSIPSPNALATWNMNIIICIKVK